ncbi:cation channel sperm-associated auxiliary subunit TMEM249 isoform X2 [Gorilla gorilla gorilla]|uniref:cation channel sperm-associated auxiliary subunit TMEM249 isoform X2 n=1 Tax=Gorilla gorilla gorilla TaxID=9595 RepID=UPI00029DC071|nr:cation channel sperm-associated auxiliary subunit TMEM249 isoform X2 [Gorilla gorilla gorilla]
MPKGRAGSLPTTSIGWRFQLWSLGLTCPERHLARRLKNNSFYPFMQQEPNGAEARDLGLPRVRRGRGPVARDLVAAAAPPGAEPYARRVPLLHPGPHRVPGPLASGLRAPGAQLRRLRKVLLPAGPRRPQVGAPGAGAAVGALRANGILGPLHRPETQHQLLRLPGHLLPARGSPLATPWRWHCGAQEPHGSQAQLLSVQPGGVTLRASPTSGLCSR